MLGQRTTGEVKVGFGMGLDTAPRKEEGEAYQKQLATGAC
jgi:hypothetical protein